MIIDWNSTASNTSRSRTSASDIVLSSETNGRYSGTSLTSGTYAGAAFNGYTYDAAGNRATYAVDGAATVYRYVFPVK